MFTIQTSSSDKIRKILFLYIHYLECNLVVSFNISQARFLNARKQFFFHSTLPQAFQNDSIDFYQNSWSPTHNNRAPNAFSWAAEARFVMWIASISMHLVLESASKQNKKTKKQKEQEEEKQKEQEEKKIRYLFGFKYLQVSNQFLLVLLFATFFRWVTRNADMIARKY